MQASDALLPSLCFALLCLSPLPQRCLFSEALRSLSASLHPEAVGRDPQDPVRTASGGIAARAFTVLLHSLAQKMGPCRRILSQLETAAGSDETKQSKNFPTFFFWAYYISKFSLTR